MIRHAPTTQLLIQKLEYFFRLKKDESFYKFVSPCDHRLYREGDSWTEELGVSRRTFIRYFDEIGVRWSSKTAFEAAKDPFLGKAYACYYDRKDNITRYFKNPLDHSHKDLGRFLVVTTQAAERHKIRDQVATKVSHRHSFSVGNAGYSEDCQSRVAKAASPLRTDKTPDKSNDLSSMGKTSVQTTTLSKEAEKITQEVQEVWKREVGGRTYQSKTFLSKLFQAFKTLFKGSLESWKAYCRKIASSRFLMGEVSKFKAWLSWAIKEETYEKLEAGEYTLGDRVSDTEQLEKQSARKQEIEKVLSIKAGKELELHRMLIERIGAALYIAWFNGLKFVLPDQQSQTLKVQTPSSFAASYIKSKFQQSLEITAQKIFSEPIEVEVV